MGDKVRYIGGWDTIALQPGKIYEIMSIEKGWYRIMTDLDEDYLFPPKLFEAVKDGDAKVVLNLNIEKR